MNQQLAPQLAELAQINKDLAELELKIVREAMVVGATVTRLFLSPKQFGAANTVIIDEASMVLAPALFHAAGMAAERVVVCGDPKQLPSIIGTNQQVLFDLLGRDIFSIANVCSGLHGAPRSPRLRMLKTQQRMHARICALIAEPMYDGDLVTGDRIDHTRPVPLFDAPITLVDTSSLFPFAGFDETGSRFNLMHAIVARNIVRHLANHDVRDVGVTAGYRAQARLIGRFLEDAGCSDCVSGTVHRFQGNEKDVMIIDLPEGQGEYRVGRFLEGESPNDVGPRLLNVAISRAKDRLVFVINRSFLDRKLPGNAVVREILYRAQSSGQVVDAARVLALDPLQPAALTQPSAFYHRPPCGVYNQDDFDGSLRADLAHARHSVIIYSAFITASRSARYGDEFRRLIAGGVKVRCVTRPPATNRADSPENTRAALAALRAIGCAVDLRTNVHHKIVAIDERFLWVGSLNPLSFTPDTQEIMVRTEGADSAREVLTKVALPKMASAAMHFHEPENPACGVCGGPTVWFQRRHARMFFCIDEACSWRVFANTVHAKASPRPRRRPAQPTA